MTENNQKKQNNDHDDEREGFLQLDVDQMDVDGFDPITPDTEERETLPC